MKIKCKSCGKMFDDETYFRICPKCGTYNSKEEKIDVEQYYYGQNATVEPDKQKTYSDPATEYNNTRTAYTQNSYTSTKTTYGQNPYANTKTTYTKNSYNSTAGGKVKDKRRFHLLPILFILAIASIVISVVMQKVMEQKAQKRSSTLDYTVTEVTTEEPFTLKEATITIHGAKLIPTDMIQGYPIGEKLIAVSYSSAVEKYHPYDQEIVAPYVLAENVYKESINQYDFTNEYTITKLGLNKKEISYINDYMRENELLYFLFSVPESTKDVVVTFEVREKESNVSTVKEKIEIPLTIEEGFANE